MAKILETRESRISQRIFTLPEIRRLAQLIASDATKLSEGKDAKTITTQLSFSVECQDGSSYKSADVDLFADDSVITRKQVISIKLELDAYERYTDRFSISIRLKHGGSDSSNQITVVGIDSKWVNGSLKAIEETICSFNPQAGFPLRHKKLLLGILAFGIGRMFWFLMDISIPRGSVPEPPPHWINALSEAMKRSHIPWLAFDYLFAFFQGYFPALFVYGKILSAYPSVELQIGPAHLLLEKKRRLVLLNIWIFGVLPLLSSLAYDLLKPMFK